MKPENVQNQQEFIMNEGRGYVYVSGALTAMHEEQRVMVRDFYESIGRHCSRYGLNAYIPHLFGDPSLNANLSPEEIYRMDREGVTHACLVIAYVSIPSLGVGAEIEMAHQAGIPVVLLYEEELPPERRISRLTRGTPNVVYEIQFPKNQPLVALQRIGNFFETFKPKEPATSLEGRPSFTGWEDP